MKRLIIFKIRQVNDEEVTIKGCDIVVLTEDEEEIFGELLNTKGFKIPPRNTD